MPSAYSVTVCTRCRREVFRIFSSFLFPFAPEVPPHLSAVGWSQVAKLPRAGWRVVAGAIGCEGVEAPSITAMYDFRFSVLYFATCALFPAFEVVLEMLVSLVTLQPHRVDRHTITRYQVRYVCTVEFVFLSSRAESGVHRASI